MSLPNEFNIGFFSLQGKNAIVTGGNTGLGQAFSLALAKMGANVFVPSIIDDGGMTRDTIEREGVRFEYMKEDLTHKEAPARIVGECVKTLGSIDILVNSAGTCLVADFLEYDRAKWDSMIELNLSGAFSMIHEAATYMVPQRSGKIINICSLFSFLGCLGSPAYAAMKHGLAGLTKACCDELAQYNIQVNGLAPGYFATNITKNTRENPETNRKILEHTPANRWGETQDLMGALVFLASRASDFVNGHLLVVDGGYLVR